MIQSVFIRARQLSWTEWALLFNAITLIYIDLVPVGIIVLFLAVVYQVVQKKCSFKGNVFNVFILCIPFIIISVKGKKKGKDDKR